MAKQILFNEEARVAMKKGIDKLASAVKMTLGPRGRAVVIEKGYGAPQVTFDGVTVAKEISFEDKFENLGAELIKQAAAKTNDNVGDGTTTSIVLAQALIDEGDRAIKNGFNVIQFGRELNRVGEVIVKDLESQRELINDSKKVEEVATLSAKDKAIGKLIAEVMEKAGKDGVVTIEDSNTITNSYEVVEGMEFDRGFISQYMVSNAEKMEASIEDPYILVTDKKISSIKEILPVLEKVMESGKKDLVIIAEDLDGEALTTLVLNKIRGVFNVLAVKAPGFGDRRKEMLEDIAVVTGAEFISDELAKKLETAEVSSLGRAHRVVSTKDKTIIVGGKGDKKVIDARVAQLKAQIVKADAGFDKEKMQERLGKLSGGVAVIKVGAPTESAQRELKQRVEDAVSATRAAMEGGIVPGGGIALYNVRLGIADEKDEFGSEESAARAVLKRALEAPIRSIIANSGENVDMVLQDLVASKHKLSGSEKVWLGFNANTNKADDLKKAGIIDPLKVTREALMNALSVATNYLMIGAAVTSLPEKKEGRSPMNGMGGGMGDF